MGEIKTIMLQYTKVRFKRAGADFVAYVRSHIPGMAASLVAATLGLPLVPYLAGADIAEELGLLIAYGVLGPTALTILVFLFFYFRAPHKIYHEQKSLIEFLRRDYCSAKIIVAKLQINYEDGKFLGDIGGSKNIEYAEHLDDWSWKVQFETPVEEANLSARVPGEKRSVYIIGKSSRHAQILIEESPLETLLRINAMNIVFESADNSNENKLGQ